MRRRRTKTSSKLLNVSESFDVLLDKGFIKAKDGNDERYEFVFSEIHYVLEILPDEQHHKNALQYYEKKKIGFDRNGYPRVTINEKNKRIHVLVWEKEHGKVPKGFYIHHKDFNVKNYNLNNLELVSPSDHHSEIYNRNHL